MEQVYYEQDHPMDLTINLAVVVYFVLIEKDQKKNQIVTKNLERIEKKDQKDLEGILEITNPVEKEVDIATNTRIEAKVVVAIRVVYRKVVQGYFKDFALDQEVEADDEVAFVVSVHPIVGMVNVVVVEAQPIAYEVYQKDLQQMQVLFKTRKELN